MRIAFVVGTSAGGTARHVRMLADGLARRGVPVTVYGPAETWAATSTGAGVGPGVAADAASSSGAVGMGDAGGSAGGSSAGGSSAAGNSAARDSAEKLGVPSRFRLLLTCWGQVTASLIAGQRYPGPPLREIGAWT